MHNNNYGQFPSQPQRSNYANDFRASLQAAPVPDYSQKKPFPKWILFVIIVAVIFGGIGILVLVISNSGRSAEELAADENIAFLNRNDEANDHAYENANSEVDVLNPAYAAEVKKNQYANYETKEISSKLSELSPAAICVRLDVSCASMARPEELSAFTKVTALNSNALSYYLDQGRVVIIKAYGDYPYTKDDGGVIVVYAANYHMGYLFTAFMPPETGNNTPLFEIRRGELINNIIGIPDCYVSKEAL